MKKNTIPGILSPEEEKFVVSVVDTIGYACLVDWQQYYESLLQLRKYHLFNSLKVKIDRGVQFVQDQTENDLLKHIFVVIAEIGLYKQEDTFHQLKTKVIIPDVIQHNVYPKLFESVTGLTIMGYRLKVEKEEEKE